MSKYPDNCTLCGKPYIKNEKTGRRMIFPYPPNHYLCYNCFSKSMDEGLGRLNKTLNTGKIDLSVDEISDIIKPDVHKTEDKKDEV